MRMPWASNTLDCFQPQSPRDGGSGYSRSRHISGDNAGLERGCGSVAMIQYVGSKTKEDDYCVDVAS